MTNLGVNMPSSRAKREKGSAVLEFGIIISVLIPLMFGTIAFGVNLGNMLQSTQITRDIAHMYTDPSKDFSTLAYQNLAVSLVQGMGGMTVNSGQGVLILSQIKEVYLADCTAAGLTAAQCTNQGQRVFANRIVIGNSALRTSNFGTPSGACTMNSSGDISSSVSFQQAACVATGFGDTILPQADGDIAYVVEGYFATPNLSFLNASWSGTASSGGTTGTYTRAIF
jgi:Flp pilus assembly protein TadG